jgi:hypothetical protein
VQARRLCDYRGVLRHEHLPPRRNYSNARRLLLAAGRTQAKAVTLR